MSKKNKTKPIQKTDTQKAEEVAKVISDNIAKEVAQDGVKALPTGARVAMAKTLRQHEFTIRRIARVLKLDVNTVMKYLNMEIEDSFRMYSDAIKKYLEEVNDSLRVLTAQKIKEKLQDTENVSLRDLAGLYKITNDVAVGGTGNKNTGTTVQILNVHPALNRSKSKDQ
ncbi:MAG: hypothetical protein D6822_07025 [Cyanobacteria bacterium J149]|nr:MAG: hypothetical protein D6822_07025 [Cyanobacteria bacterium J149]